VEWNVDGGSWQLTEYNSNNGYYEALWDTTANGNGPKTLNARAIDSASRSGSDSKNVTVFNPLPAFHVGDIQVTAAHVSGPRYRGEATVSIVDEGNLPLGGVSVDGTFTGDWSGSSSATTDSNGWAVFETPPVKDGSNWTFCVDNAAKSGWIYDVGANVETCDSNGGSGAFGAISGTVRDNGTTLPIQGATVSADTGQSTTTNTDGNYTLSSVPTGDRTVSVTANGYTPQQKQTSVTESTPSFLDFVLDPSTSGGSGSIKGTVTDSDGSKLGGVLIETDSGHSAISNRGGKYSIQNVPEGPRTVTASAAGYLPEQQAVTVIAGQTATADFSLSTSTQ
jgi:hypothetical protein